MHWTTTALWGGKKVELRETQRAVTLFGGLVVFFRVSAAGGLSRRSKQASTVSFYFTNAIDPVETFTAFLLSVVAGVWRFAHTTSLLRTDLVLQALLGAHVFLAMTPLEPVQTVRSGTAPAFSPACGVGNSSGFRNVPRATVWIWTSTGLERYGQQQGALRGSNPRKHGGPSHHPFVAVLLQLTATGTYSDSPTQNITSSCSSYTVGTVAGSTTVTVTTAAKISTTPGLLRKTLSTGTAFIKRSRAYYVKDVHG